MPQYNGDSMKNIINPELHGIEKPHIFHPETDALFMFDNSQNHHALALYALKSKVLTLKDNGANAKPQRFNKRMAPRSHYYFL